MRSAVRILTFFLCVASIAGCGDDPIRNRDGGTRDGSVSVADEDGDGISDADENRATLRDSDGDGTEDYLDDDSDDDGYPDAEEAGDDDPATPPRDTDGDTVPDFIDTDADGNGILDADEIPGDLDGDTRPNYRDPDDDDDGLSDVREVRGMVTPPADTDGDGTPDYQDRDSDDDLILDGHDGDIDTDADLSPDFQDTDSDEDSIPDSVEAGDTDPMTPPVDTDEDGVPDFRDPDSDGDGLSDRDETTGGTSPILDDTDMDGVSDLIEVAAGTNPTDMADSPRTRGDFVFTVPYMEPPDPTRDTLSFRTSIQFADIYFLFDASGSMGGEQTNLGIGVSTIIADLTCADSGTACMRDSECAGGQVCSPFSMTCIEDPGTSSCILSAWTGAGQYGQAAGSGNLLINRTSLQPSPAATSAGIALIPEDGGTEPLYGAVWSTVDPVGSPMPEMGCAPAMAGRIGCVGYRSEAVRILVAFSDEDSDGAVTAAQAAAALTATGVTFIGVPSAAAARTTMVNLANLSGSTDGTGAPLVFDAAADGSGIATVVTNAINEIVEGVPLRVTIVPTDEPDDAGDALQFIDRLETNTTAADCASVPTEDTNGDGVQDAFPAVTPGTRVCWDVVPLQNDTVMPMTTPQVFKARLTVYGDGSPLDSRLVYFLVPPRPPVVEGPG